MFKKRIGLIEPIKRKELDKTFLKYFSKSKKDWVWEVKTAEGGYTFESEEHAHIMSKLLEIEQMIKRKRK